MVRVYSLTTVTVTLINRNNGAKITIGGNNNTVGNISYDFSNSMFGLESTPDGGAAVSFNKSKAGTINITFKQTSPKIQELTEFLKWCWQNPKLAESTLTIQDTLGIVQCEANGVFPDKYPGNSAGPTAGDRAFGFIASEINPD